MTRRPKLSLSPEHNANKKLPPGFETTAKAEHPQTSHSAAAQSSGIKERKPEKIAARDPASTDNTISLQTTAWPTQQKRQSEKSGPRDPASANNKPAPQATTWPAKQIVKVAIAVVAAALSLYLLKRRFL